MTFKVVFTPEGEAQLIDLFNYIAERASPEIAAKYTDGVLSYCQGLRIFPLRGFARDDIRPGLRMTNYRKRTMIAYDVADDVVSIIGVFHGGQDYHTALLANDD